MTRFIQNWKMYERIPMKNSKTLPDEGFEPRLVDIIDNPAGFRPFLVYCNPKADKRVPRGSGKHRVIVICNCGRHIPFGRMGQHYKRSVCS
jgi:hypothetical protein